MLSFSKIILHNFGSYHHAEIELQNKGFCLVTGENHHIQDNALSNGSGKSFIWSGICFALTGETIQGLKSNLKNIHVDEDTAYVQLEFMSDGANYDITRIIAPHSDLKIIKDGDDVSGKGIRESEEILHDLLPDITQELIASSIIIGQGMPNKFSAFKPSGRKELLEKLTKSDFMIEDIKSRIAARFTTLNDNIRQLEDRLLVDNTTLAGHNTSLTSYNAKLTNRVKPDFETNIANSKAQIASIEADVKRTQNARKEQEAAIEKLNEKLVAKTNEKATETSAL